MMQLTPMKDLLGMEKKFSAIRGCFVEQVINQNIKINNLFIDIET